MKEAEYEELLQQLLKQYKRKKPDIPARVVEQSINEVAKVYSTAYKKLFGELLNDLVSDFGILATPSYQSQLSLLMKIELRMKELDSSVQTVVMKELERVYASGHVFHALAENTVKTIEQLKGAVPFSSLTMYKADQIVADTMEDLLFSTQHTSKELKKLVREVFSKNIHYHGLKELNQHTMKKIIEKELSKKMLEEALRKKGFVGIIDKSGRKWNTQVYVDMAVSTKMNQAYVEGVKDRAIETGKDLAVIPEKGAKDSCSNFEGMIISMTGATKGYMTYDQLQATGLIFHPRCRHSPVPIGRIELMPKEDIDFHNSKIKKLKKLKK